MVPDTFISDMVDGNRIRTMNHTLELIPHQSPESGAVVLARSNGLEPQVLLQLDNLADGFLFEYWQSSGFCGDSSIGNLLAHLDQVLWT